MQMNVFNPFFVPLGLTARQALELVYHRAGLSRLEMPPISRWRENKVEVYIADNISRTIEVRVLEI